jgi:hypothetical protein
MPSRLVTVARFASIPEAQLAQTALRLEGIDAYLEGEGMAWLYSSAVEGVKLQVAAADTPRAVAVLHRAGERRLAGDDPELECETSISRWRSTSPFASPRECSMSDSSSCSFLVSRPPVHERGA